MTNKIQYSKKYDNGEIIVVGGETVEEFTANFEKMTDFMNMLEETAPEHKTPDTGGFPGDTFTVENIKLASGGEHPRWVVMGGNFTKYGVTCWPEVLKDAGILDKLDPLKDNNPSGKWTAHYQKKVDGKPDKVVKLERE